ncbi:MAG: hypothetical protein Q4G13_05055 [Moraxella sp.]|nr:hypothetical protein [Moraxella sp.]
MSKKDTVFEPFDELSTAAVQEIMLEFVQAEDGKLVLREAKNHDEVLVSIDFSDKVKEMLGSDTQMVGEQMVQAAFAAVMRQQMSRWHAHIYDEVPARYS